MGLQELSLQCGVFLEESAQWQGQAAESGHEGKEGFQINYNFGSVWKMECGAQRALVSSSNICYASWSSFGDLCSMVRHF